MLVFDTSSKESFTNLDKWYDEVMSIDQGAQIMLVGTKSDIESLENFDD